MKRYLILLSMMLLLSYTSSHAQKNTDTTVYTAVEVPPQPAGGMGVFMKHLNNLRYPKICKQSNITGKIIIQFIVKEDGKLINPEFIYPENICPESKNYLSKLIENTPAWIPGKMGGKNVKVRYTLPIHIHLQE